MAQINAEYATLRDNQLRNCQSDYYSGFSTSRRERSAPSKPRAKSVPKWTKKVVIEALEE